MDTSGSAWRVVFSLSKRGGIRPFSRDLPLEWIPRPVCGEGSVVWKTREVEKSKITVRRTCVGGSWSLGSDATSGSQPHRATMPFVPRKV